MSREREHPLGYVVLRIDRKLVMFGFMQFKIKENSSMLSKPCVCATLLLLLTLCFVPFAGAQLFGGSIKAGKQYRLPSSITLGQIPIYTTVSVYDADYVPYSAPTVAATTTSQAADGTAESKIVDYQGSITTTGITLAIPVTATASGSLLAFSSSVSVPSSMTQDGISRTLVLSWDAQSYTTATTSITVTLKAQGGTLNVKKLDINTGIGNDCLGVLLGAISYPYSGTLKKSFQVRAIACVPDRMFNQTDNSGTVEHNFLYMPIVAEDGKVWLSNNLGAVYADINNANYNIAQQAKSVGDTNAMGSLFQWGRKPDGHELTDWSSTTDPLKYDPTYLWVDRDNPSVPNFIKAFFDPYDWRENPADNLWTGESAVNNPCPLGFRVPTLSELTGLMDIIFPPTTSLTKVAVNEIYDSLLKFTAAGRINADQGKDDWFGCDCYWTSDVDGSYAYYRFANMYNATMAQSLYRAIGHSVRCIKN